MITRSEQELSSYLHYGYIPHLEEDFATRPWARVRRADVLPDGAVARAELVRAGELAFRAACALPGDGPHVVPLSGGVDSRFLLATLLEAGLGPRIVTVAFGIPGALDLELAARVAAAAGVRHESIDLAQLVVTHAELAACARAAPWCYTLEAFWSREIVRRHGRDATYWSGIMANVFAGKDLLVPTPDWESACRAFAQRSRFLRWRDLTAPGFDPVAVLPARPPLADAALAPLEQLYAFLRYPGRIDPTLLAPGVHWRTPFRAEPWVGFMLRVPRALRADPGFYREIAARSSAALFALPTKNDLGLAPRASGLRQFVRRARHKLGRELATRFPALSRYHNPFLNYVDLERELRGDGSLGTVVTELVERLAARRALPWLDPRELLARHRARRENLGEHLALLATLELHLALESPDSGR